MSQPTFDPDELTGPHPEDPVEENPVPQGHPAHKVWEDATAAALEEVYHLNAEILAEQPNSDGLPDWRYKLVFRKYQIWAKRNLAIVRNEKDARGYERWLDNYMQSWIDTLTAKFGPPTPIFKAQLVGACSYWKGNAWAQVRASGLLAEGGPHEASGDPSDADRGRTRSFWVDTKRAVRGWTSDVDIVNNGGPTYNTIRRYRSGQRSTRDPYVKSRLAQAFDCDISEVPD